MTEVTVEIQDIVLVTLQVLSPVIVAALAWLSAKLAEFIRAKVQGEYLRGVLIRLDDAVFTAVKPGHDDRRHAAGRGLAATPRPKLSHAPGPERHRTRYPAER
jgi:hypothetical protein